MITDSLLRNSNIEDFCDNPFTPPSQHMQKNNSLDRKPLKRTLRSTDQDAEVELSAIDDFGGCEGVERLGFL